MKYVVHCKRNSYNIYIGRPSKWGNPYVIGIDGNREEVIKKYRIYIIDKFGEEKIREELKGKILGCWCYPLPCHGDVLSEIANGE